MNDIISREQVAVKLNVSAETIYKMEKDGRFIKKIPTTKRGEKTFYSTKEYNAWYRKRKRTVKLSDDQKKYDLKTLVYGCIELYDSNYYRSNRDGLGNCIKLDEVKEKVTVGSFLFDKRNLTSFDDVKPNMDSLIEVFYDQSDKKIKYVDIRNIDVDDVIKGGLILLKSKTRSYPIRSRKVGGVKRTLKQWYGFFKWLNEEKFIENINLYELLNKINNFEKISNEVN